MLRVRTRDADQLGCERAGEAASCAELLMRLAGRLPEHRERPACMPCAESTTLLEARDPLSSLTVNNGPEQSDESAPGRDALAPERGLETSVAVARIRRRSVGDGASSGRRATVGVRATPPSQPFVRVGCEGCEGPSDSSEVPARRVPS
jgi:hypothetical protein